jgi:hypothetical protein
VWLIAFASLVASFLLQAVALRFGALSAVEPIITLEVPLTLLLASRVFPGRLSRGDWASILIMTAGMAGLVGALGPSGGDPTEVDDLTYVTAGAATAAGITGLVLIAGRGGPMWRTACLGAAAGTSFGMTATMIKATMAALAVGGISGLLTAWQTYVAVGSGVTGLILVQAALHAGPLLAAQPGFHAPDLRRSHPHRRLAAAGHRRRPGHPHRRLPPRPLTPASTTRRASALTRACRPTCPAGCPKTPSS